MNRLPVSIFSYAIFCITFASCGSHLSITKRQHSSGYYVDYGRHHTSSEIIEKKATQAALSNEWLNASSDEKLDLHSNSSVISQANTEKYKVSVSHNPNPAELSAKSAKRKPFQEIAAVMKVKKALSNDVFTKPAASTPENALSILWLVILIVLLLWLLGYLFGGFGLGPLIHLLLLIALILFILWLLRVI